MCAALGRYCGIRDVGGCLLCIRYIFLRDALRIVIGRRNTFGFCFVVLLYFGSPPSLLWSFGGHFFAFFGEKMVEVPGVYKTRRHNHLNFNTLSQIASINILLHLSEGLVRFRFFWLGF